MRKVAVILVWFIFFMVILSEGCYMLTYPDTVSNILGLIMLVSFSVLSVSTKCFTSIIQSKSNEDNEK